jgi:SPP1 gp7 family putative phage head morphogenesis protein
MTKIRNNVKDFMVIKDALGLNVQPREYEFRTSSRKLAAFNEWFAQQVEAGLLSAEVGTPAGQPWSTKYVESAYRRGLLNAFLASKKAKGLDQTAENFLRSSFGAPEAFDKIALLGTRVFENMKGLTGSMKAEMSRILASGLANGEGAEGIAKTMVEDLGLSEDRALMIARTEIINAHAEGQLDAFEQLGVEELGVQAEWTTAGDERVCPECEDMEGQVFSVEEARGMIPLHPNCRCSWTPYLGKA